VDWLNLAEDREKWQTLMYMQGSIKCRESVNCLHKKHSVTFLLRFEPFTLHVSNTVPLPVVSPVPWRGWKWTVGCYADCPGQRGAFPNQSGLGHGRELKETFSLVQKRSGWRRTGNEGGKAPSMCVVTVGSLCVCVWERERDGARDTDM